MRDHRIPSAARGGGMRRTRWIVCGALACLAGCGDDPSLDRTIATVEGVRGESTVDEAVVVRVARAAPGDAIAIGERGLARLSLDGGPRLLVDAETQASVIDESRLRLTAGRVFAEVGEG